MTLQVTNSLTRRLEPFEPADPKRVTMYACGPTVYSYAHIGNWATNLVCDVLVRWLTASGYGVKFVMNITDVEDKTIRDSRKEAIGLAEFTETWTDIFFEDSRALGCKPADKYPRATAFIEPMVEMIQVLLDKGHAYAAEDEDGSTSIYFRVISFEHYGEMANLTQDQIRAGASGRVRADEYEKENVGDFALWKGWTEADGDVFWEPEFAIEGEPRILKGRPGWHIECSVMSQTLLGDQIDLHLGGEDLRFPHHQNEIAQCEAATGKRPFVRYWMHRRYLLVDGRKMAKSQDNFYTLRDLRERLGASAARGFRYMVVSAHYLTPIDFTWSGLEAALKTLRNLDDAWARLIRLAGDAAPSAFAAQAEASFREAMDNDLETSAALAAVHLLIGQCNRRAEAGTLFSEDAASALDVLRLADEVLGLGLGAPQRELTAEQAALVEARQAAREQKNWAESDRLRDVLREQGIVVKDSKEGQEVRFL